MGNRFKIPLQRQLLHQLQPHKLPQKKWLPTKFLALVDLVAYIPPFTNTLNVTTMDQFMIMETLLIQHILAISASVTMVKYRAIGNNVLELRIRLVFLFSFLVVAVLCTPVTRPLRKNVTSSKSF